ncbi:MAG: FAD-binding oxidoreductase [Leptospiraceae bacterium]|nr:FAD-binding oxidoreductase [Leptospiraceae bacterium]
MPAKKKLPVKKTKASAPKKTASKPKGKSEINNKTGSWRESFHWGVANKPLDHSNETHVDFFSKALNAGHGELDSGDSAVQLKVKSKLSARHLGDLRKICGDENISVGDFERVKHSYGKYYEELVEQRTGKIEHIVDAVAYPADEDQILKILQYCQKNRIAVTPYGAGSSVTKALRTPRGGLSLDLSRHFHRILSFSKQNSSVTCEAGVLGPALEEFLNRQGFTCGHFPQSFEFSTVGGWAAARGAGQASTGYGRMEEMVLGMTVITPKGKLEFVEIPASAVGPDLKRLFIGSEGTLGVITRITMRVSRYNPKNTRYLSFLFKDFESSVAAMRNIMQAQIGKPHVFRISDGEETDVAFKMKNKDKGLTGKILKALGYAAGERCLMYATVEGNRDYTAFVASQMKKIARKSGGLPTGSYPVKKWLEQRYSSAYVRDPLMDAGVRIDTLETAVRWDNLMRVWENTRAYIKSFENTFCLVHISHVYETGANLYFVFASRMTDSAAKKELSEFAKLHRGIVETIIESGGTLSHHHGIGRLTSPYLEKAMGKEAFTLLKDIKKSIDVAGILNPGALNL